MELPMLPPAAPADDAGASGLWVFGYGSLCWHPGFDFSRSVTGFVRGYARKFWQGNTTHRGTEGQPGRVATLVEERDGVVWGRAFELSGEAALPYLANRECKLGGYVTKFATFFPKRPCTGPGDEALDAAMPGQPFPALLYVATPSNRLWLGEAPLSQIARQIVSCRGATGHNVEYLLRLADYMRAAAPEADDEHLFSLEQLVRHEIRQRRLCLDTLMGASPATELATEASAATVLGDLDSDDDEAGLCGLDGLDDGMAAGLRRLYQQQHPEPAAPQAMPQAAPVPLQAGPAAPVPLEEAGAAGAATAPAFASRVPNKRLRCLNI